MSEHFKNSGFTWQAKGSKKSKNGRKGQKESFLGKFHQSRKVDNSFSTQRDKGSKGQRLDLVDFP
ncbi:MAG: hypothetical protein ACRERV_18730 [Methylococcales bacterium]